MTTKKINSIKSKIEALETEIYVIKLNLEVLNGGLEALKNDLVSELVAETSKQAADLAARMGRA